MDPVALTFYAIVCGGLAALAPRFGTFVARLVAGAITGLVAATILPLLRTLFGL